MSASAELPAMKITIIPTTTEITNRRTFTPHEKLQIIEDVRIIGFNQAQRKYQIQGNQISKWRKNESLLRDIVEQVR